MTLLLAGAIAMACAIVGLFCLRYWKSSGDSFFLLFAVSFWLQGGQWLHAGLAGFSTSEYSPWYYLPRLLAYVLIVYAVLRKNLGRNPGPRTPTR